MWHGKAMELHKSRGGVKERGEDSRELSQNQLLLEEDAHLQTAPV